MTKSCITCSSTNLDDAVYCEKCGSKLGTRIIKNDTPTKADTDFLSKEVKLYPPTNVNRREREDFVEVVSTTPGTRVEIIPEFKLEESKGKTLLGFPNVNGYNLSEIINGTLRSYKKLLQFIIPMFLLISLISILITQAVLREDQVLFSSFFISKSDNFILNQEIMSFYKIISIIPTLMIFILVINFHVSKKFNFKETFHNLVPILPGFTLLFYFILELYSLSFYFSSHAVGTTWEIIINLIFFLFTFILSSILSIGLGKFFVNNFMTSWNKKISLLDAIKSGANIGYKNLLPVLVAFTLIKSLGFGLNALLDQILPGYHDFSSNPLTAGVFTLLIIGIIGPIEPILIIIYYLLDLENKRILQGRIWTNKK
jgi:hypothetical protein